MLFIVIVLVAMLTGSIVVEDNEEVVIPMVGLCYRNIDSPNVCNPPELKPLVYADKPIGGLDDEVEIVEAREDSSGIPVKMSQVELPEDLPDIVILPPIVCPNYTQYFHSYHRGIDLVNRNCNGSDWIIAVNKGTVTFVGWLGDYGQRVEITHEDGFVTTYSHLSAVDVSVGDELKLGQKIGTIGTTGKSTGVHLHFEVIYNGVKIDPEPLL